MAKGFDTPLMTEVRSSNIKAIGYDEAKQELFIEFLHKDSFGHASRFIEGDLYRYYKVPKAIYERLMAAASKGTYIWESIRGRYRYRLKGRAGWRGPSNRVEERARNIQKTKKKKR